MIEPINIIVVKAPPFAHEYKGEWHNYLDPKSHTYRGSFARHISIERPAMRLRSYLLYRRDTGAFFFFFNFIFDLILGLNCNFPTRDVMKYSVWMLKFLQETSKYELQMTIFRDLR